MNFVYCVWTTHDKTHTPRRNIKTNNKKKKLQNKRMRILVLSLFDGLYCSERLGRGAIKYNDRHSKNEYSVKNEKKKIKKLKMRLWTGP